MRKKLQIGFVTGLVILIAGIVLICSYEGSGTAWPLPIPDSYRAVIFTGTCLCFVSGLLLAALNKIQK